MKSSLIWLLEGGAIPALLCISGLFFLFYLKGYPFRTPRRMVRAMMHRSGSGVSPFRAVTLALAGTLGVGNIVGVANALWLGGAPGRCSGCGSPLCLPCFSNMPRFCLPFPTGGPPRTAPIPAALSGTSETASPPAPGRFLPRSSDC